MSAGTGSADKHVEIRKYPNRRYYDATRSRHLTLQDIRTLIRDGYDIRVTDSKTGADITAQVLTQIILELETPKLDSFPVPLLTRLIRVNDQMVKDFIETYFHQALNAFLEYQKQIEQRIRQMPGFPGLYPPFSAWTQAMLTPFPTGPAAASSEKPAGPAPTPGAEANAEELRDLVKNLQQQVAGLQKKLARSKTRGRRAER